jgi:PPOX class probable F420-dependent enzyme
VALTVASSGFAFEMSTSGASAGIRRAVVPASHEDLLERPLDAVLTTEMPDGRLQSTVVWFSRDGDDVLVNTMREFQKARNLRDRPRATLLVPEPPDARRWTEIRGTVTLESGGALEHLDSLARAYAGADHYFGGVIPASFAETEHPVLCRINPTAVVVGPSTAAIGTDARRATASLPAHRPCRDEPSIPDSHRSLLERPVLAALSTRLPHGAQTHPVWFELEGNDVLVNTTLERVKGRSLVRDPRATVLVVDPEETTRWIEIRGDVDLQTEGAVEERDRVTRRYTRHPRFFGFVYPEERRMHETRIVARIHPRRINVLAPRAEHTLPTSIR